MVQQQPLRYHILWLQVDDPSTDIPTVYENYKDLKFPQIRVVQTKGWFKLKKRTFLTDTSNHADT